MKVYGEGGNLIEPPATQKRLNRSSQNFARVIKVGDTTKPCPDRIRGFVSAHALFRTSFLFRPTRLLPLAPAKTPAALHRL